MHVICQLLQREGFLKVGLHQLQNLLEFGLHLDFTRPHGDDLHLDIGAVPLTYQHIGNAVYQ